ncbi:MAG: hypothetical protein AUJ49_08430 [Desulfovibrionaceae bacterium CG1_02_65_16]|nr:MAG: hypothetical protein AUJ49_08430 [Desulfovibrionaceae bacterium CG1_02_65_16]
MLYAQNMKTMNSVARQVYMRNHIGALDTFPEEIILLPTMRCNYNCVTCGQNHADEREYPQSFMEELKGILPFAKFVNITGGEPLLYKHFDELISVISAGHCDYWLVTNASLLTERWRAKLLDSPLRTIKFSIDGGSPQAYARVRPVGNFFKVLKNIAEFMRDKYARGRLDIHTQFNFVALKDNIDSLPKLVAIAGDLGIHQVNVIYCVCDSEYLAERSLFFNQELSDEKMLLAREIGLARGVDVALPKLFSAQAPEAESWLNARTCDFPFKFMAVELDGKIGTCCGTSIRRGNIFRDGFAATWNDPFWVRLRETVNTPDELEMCRNCTLCKQAPGLAASHIPNADLARRAALRVAV